MNILTLKGGQRYVEVGESLYPLPLPDHTIMKPELVDALLEDMDIPSAEAREATKKYCLEMIDFGDMECGDMLCAALTFVDGYGACLKNHS